MKKIIVLVLGCLALLLGLAGGALYILSSLGIEGLESLSSITPFAVGASLIGFGAVIFAASLFFFLKKEKILEKHTETKTKKTESNDVKESKDIVKETKAEETQNQSKVETSNNENVFATTSNNKEESKDDDLDKDDLEDDEEDAIEENKEEVKKETESASSKEVVEQKPDNTSNAPQQSAPSNVAAASTPVNKSAPVQQQEVPQKPTQPQQAAAPTASQAAPAQQQKPQQVQQDAAPAPAQNNYVGKIVKTLVIRKTTDGIILNIGSAGRIDVANVTNGTARVSFSISGQTKYCNYYLKELQITN